MNNGRMARSREGTSVEEAILSALQGKEAELSMIELLDRVSECGIGDEDAIKAAITRLLAESKLEMSPRRRIHVALNSCRR